jgi:phosphatidylglycerophosphate synthase
MNIIRQYKQSLKMPEVEEVLDLVLYRPVALVFVNLVHRTPLTPNGVTFLSFLCGMASAYSFAQGTPQGLAGGGMWYALANVFDCSDGQLARLQGSGTPLGRLVDGVVDWAVSIAIFAGTAIGWQRVTGDSATWFLVVAGGVTSALHSFYFDMYQQQFISVVRGQKNFIDAEVEKISAELRHPGNPVRALVLRIYWKYLHTQQQTRPPELRVHYPAEKYRAANRKVIRFWTILGPTTNRSLLIIAGLVNNLNVFFWPVITLGNLLFIIALAWQRRVTERLKVVPGGDSASPLGPSTVRA